MGVRARQHDVPAADRYTAVFDDFVEGISGKKLLLDHILLAPGLTMSAGLRRVAHSGEIHHAEYNAQVSAGGVKREDRPLGPPPGLRPAAVLTARVHP